MKSQRAHVHTFGIFSYLILAVAEVVANGEVYAKTEAGPRITSYAGFALPAKTGRRTFRKRAFARVAPIKRWLGFYRSCE